MKKHILIIVLLTFGFVGFTQMVPSGLVNAFEKGDARTLSNYFHDNLEIKLLDDEYVASKVQATRIIQQFFKEYPPQSFKMEYEGGKQDSKYGLGTLVCSKASFRVNMYFMEGMKDKTIYFLSIEKI